MASRRNIRAKETELAFEALSIEGSLLSPEWLSKVAQLSAGSQTEADYRVPKGLNLRDEIGRYWRIAQAHWKDFSAGIASKAEPSALAGRFVTALLKESFGFESLSPVAPVVLSERQYPIGHSALGNRVPVVIAPAATGIDTLSPAFGDDGRRRSPFGLAQEYLNAAEGALWGVVTDGLTLRIVRDNASLTRPAWIEADLPRIFTEERYADFAALWLLLHETRFGRDGQAVTECALETWRNAGKEEGTRAREHLRNGVEDALVALGHGFLSHAENKTLRAALQDGSLSTRDYFSQLLRLVYRLIFLLTVEERNLLHPEGTSDPARSLYAEGYSLRRLREKSVKRSAHDRFSDLWESTKLVFRGLATGEPRLGLPALAGIFASRQCMALDSAKLENRALLLAAFKLAWLREDGALARVNWRDMGPEELGSVYESLLELVPQISKEGRQFGFATGGETKGNARKTTGSYYTPDSLVQVLLDSALEPVIADRLREAERIASGEWRAVPGEWRTASGEALKKFYGDSILSGSGSVAASASPGQGSLSSHKQVSEGGAFRNDLTDPAGLDLDPGQHSGRMGPSLSSGVHTVSADCEREPDRTGNAPDSQRGRGAMPTGIGSAPASGNHNSRETTTLPGEKSATQTDLRPAPFAIPDSQLASFWDSTPFAIRHSLIAQQALLTLAIVDPACGSGHFLLAAARRLASHVARVQANGTPSGAQYRHALRQVVGHCVYGVDLNPMAVELCKVSLWMEAVEPGLPLTFLNSHIQHGNALLGTTPDLMAKGIPDAAWDPIEGDDRKVASALKKRNKQGATGQRSLDTLWSQPSDSGAKAVAKAVSELDATSDADAGQLAQKEAKWENILCSTEYRQQKFIADSWCAAFVWPKNPGPLAEVAPTNELWRQIRDGQGKPPALTEKTVERLAAQYRFFHWHIQFPQVFAKGGFDVVLGNPPWEHIELQEEEWFAERNPEVANAATSAIRKRLIERLAVEAPSLYAGFRAAQRQLGAETSFIRSAGRYPLCAQGRINTYSVFAEHNVATISPKGRGGFVVPTGIATDDTTKDFFTGLVDGERLVSLLDFQSGPGLFGAIGHGTFKFCLITVAGSRVPAPALYSFYSRSVQAALSTNSVFSLTKNDFIVFNPNTRTCPTFRSRRDAEINLAIYKRAGVLWREGGTDGNAWYVRFTQGLFNMASDSSLFRTTTQLETAGYKFKGNTFLGGEGRFLPLLEAKMVHHFNHRYGDYRDHPEGSENLILPDVPDGRLADPSYSVVGRYWVSETDVAERLRDLWSREWLLGWRDVTKPQNERTVVASLVPHAGIGHKFPLLMSTAEPPIVACLYGSLCSFCLDYAARQKVGGTSLSYFILKQLPVLPPNSYSNAARWDSMSTVAQWLLPRVLELTYTAWDLKAFACDVGFNDPPFRWDPARRFTLRCELDAAFFHLYLPCDANGGWRFLDSESPAIRQSLLAASPSPRDAVSHIMDTFPIARKNDEKAHGEYRTKRVILEIYDAMAEAIRTGKPYQTRLDPPPADPKCCHPAKP